jgi:RNA polymerase sigma-70 factor (ECF subfamily)
MPSSSRLPESPGRPASAGAPFLTTRWSLVLAAGRAAEPSSRRALAELCETYWYPLYAYVRRHGHRPEDAQDLTQAFFARLLERNDFGAADPARGRFRAFLLGSMRHFLANEWDRLRAEKRGGGRVPLSLDFQAADERFGAEASADLSPERAFDRSWALAVLERVLDQLGREHEARGRGRVFGVLRETLVAGSPGTPYRELAQRLGLSAGAVKVAVHRLRHAFRDALRREIAQTVAGPAQLEVELEALIEALGNG